MKNPYNSEETSSWSKLYHNPILKARRLKQHKRRLKKTGILDIDKNSIVMELCCGSGENLHILHECGFRNIYGIDLTIDKKTKTNHYYAKLIAGDARNVPLPSETFDCVICLHSLHHLGSYENITEIISESIRLLKPQGYLGIVDHYPSPQLSFVFWLLKKQWSIFPEWMRLFGRQLVEEKSYLDKYFKNWKFISNLIKNCSLKQICYKKGVFFFYYRGRK